MTEPKETEPVSTTGSTPTPKKASKPRKPKVTVSKSDDRKVLPGRMVKGARPTMDEEHAAKHNGKPLNAPAKTLGRQIELHDRVIIHTRNAINGQSETPAYVTGFNPKTGNPNLRIEALTPALATTPMDFGNVPQNAPAEDFGPFWYWPDRAGTAKE